MILPGTLRVTDQIVDPQARGLQPPLGHDSITGMTQMISGTVEAVSPTRLAAPHAAPAHAFFNTMRDVIVRTTAYHTEQEKLDALDAIDRYERQVVNAGDLRQVSDENDRAPIEDARLRQGPNGGPQLPVRVPGAAVIDYDQLAAAMFRIQATQAAAAAAASSGPVVPASGA